MRSEAAASPGVGPIRFVRRRWMGWILLPFYAFLFGEVFVRLLAPVPMIPRYVTGAPYGVRVAMPHMKFWQTTPEVRVQVRTNSRGIRSDLEYPYAKPADTCRVVLLGDSLFVGYEVNVEDSFAYLLDRRLKADGYRCEVINLAVSGFGTAEMLVTLREEALKYGPDFVVFSSHVTDLDDNIRSSLFSLDERGLLQRGNTSFLPGIRVSDELSKFALYRWLVENSQLYSAARERSAEAIKSALVDARKSGTEEEAAATAGKAASAAAAKKLNLALLEEGARLSESHKAKFAVLEIPVCLARTEFVRMLPEYDAETALQLRVFDPLLAFRAAADPARKLYFEQGHGHLTPEGNRVLADYFQAAFLKTGWLEPWKD